MPRNAEQTAKKTGGTPILKIVCSLLAICTVCAAILGSIYLVTAAQILDNETRTVSEKLQSIYGEDCEFADRAVPEGAIASGVWQVTRAHENAGLAVRTSSRGFSDDIDLIVGFDETGAILKIEIVSIAETAGIGEKVKEESYLANYTGKSGPLVLNEDVDAISGATRSSTALMRGVNQAIDCYEALKIKEAA